MKITEAEDVTFVSLLPKTQHKKHRRKRGLRHVMLGITLLGASPKMLLLGFWLFCEGIFAKTPKPRTYKGWRERRKNRGVILKGKCGGELGERAPKREKRDTGFGTTPADNTRGALQLLCLWFLVQHSVPWAGVPSTFSVST